jgi:hypothetical protein
VNDLIETDAQRFVKTMLNSSLNSIRIAKLEFDIKLVIYPSDNNKYKFLKSTKKAGEELLFEHRKKCQKTDCAQVIGSQYLNFVINQELEIMAKYFKPGDFDKDEFSTTERIQTNSKVDDVLQKLSDLGLGQEILFEEINNLREHFNLDKKNWVQLLKGKLVELGMEKVIDITVADMIFKTLTESIKAGNFQLPQ